MRASSYVLYSNCQVRLIAEQLSLRSDYFENKLPLPFRLQRRKIVIAQSTAARDQTNGCEARDALHNSGEAVAVGSGWAARRLFAANSTAIGNKNNAADRPSPADYRSQGVVQSVPNSVDAGVLRAMRQRIELPANAIMARLV